MTLDEAITDIKNTYTRQQIIDLATVLHYGKDGTVTANLYGKRSPCRVVLVNLLDERSGISGTREGVSQLMTHYQIPQDFIPAVPVFHEALGLVVQLKRVLSLLFTDPEMVGACHRFMVSPDWAGVLGKLVSLVDCPHGGVSLPDSPGDVTLMSRGEVEAILRRVVSLPQLDPTEEAYRDRGTGAG